MFFDKANKTSGPDQPTAMSILPPPDPLCTPVTDIEPYAQHEAYDKNDKSSPLHKLWIKVGSGELSDQEVYIGPAFVMIAQMPAHHPMPVRAKTIAPAIPYSQDEPGPGGEQQRNEIPLSGRPESPPYTIKKG